MLTFHSHCNIARKRCQHNINYGSFPVTGHCLWGIVSLDGYIDSEDLFDAMDDPLTYFLDTSRDAYFRAYFSSCFYPKSSMRNLTARFKSQGNTFNSSVVWQLEDLKYNGYDYGE